MTTFRYLEDSDAGVLDALDVGGASPWLEEVAEIVAGLWAWRDDPSRAGFDRQVIVVEVDGEIDGVAAHERLEHERFGVMADHRYLMIVAIRSE